jgi:hypothetical protein
LSSCGGAHVLYTLAAILRAEQQFPLLSPQIRSDLQFFLVTTASAIASMQRSDGVIPADWNLRLARAGWYQEFTSVFRPKVSHDSSRLIAEWSDVALESNDRRSLVLSTGHTLEWIALLPPECQPSKQIFEQGAKYLAVVLAETDEAECREGYCPYSHAARMLRLLGKRSSAACQPPRITISGRLVGDSPSFMTPV